MDHDRTERQAEKWRDLAWFFFATEIAVALACVLFTLLDARIAIEIAILALCPVTPLAGIWHYTKTKQFDGVVRGGTIAVAMITGLIAGRGAFALLGLLSS
jgi:hypothetical protein